MAEDSSATTSVDFPKLLEHFKTYLAEERHLTPATIRAYQTDATAFARANGVLCSSDLCQVTSEQIQSYLDRLNEMGYQSSAIVRRITCLRQLGWFLIRRGWCSQTRLTDIPIPKVPLRPRPGLSQDDVHRLLSVPPSQEFPDLRRRVVVELAYATGMRLHELAALDIDDLDLTKNTVRLRHRRHGAAELPFGSSVIAALQPYLEARTHVQGSNPQKNSALFLNSSGDRFSRRGVNKDLARCARAARLPRFSSQTLRATYAKLELEQGATLGEVQARLGLQAIDGMTRYLSTAAVKDGDNKP